MSASSPSSTSSSGQAKIACRCLLARFSSGSSSGSLILSAPSVSRVVTDLFFDYLGAAGRLPAALAAASSPALSTTQSMSSSSISMLVWVVGSAPCGQSTPGGGDTNIVALSRPLTWVTKGSEHSKFPLTLPQYKTMGMRQDELPLGEVTQA